MEFETTCQPTVAACQCRSALGPLLVAAPTRRSYTVAWSNLSVAFFLSLFSLSLAPQCTTTTMCPALPSPPRHAHPAPTPVTRSTAPTHPRPDTPSTFLFLLPPEQGSSSSRHCCLSRLIAAPPHLCQTKIQNGCAQLPCSSP
jgi:hypothetical protein